VLASADLEFEWDPEKERINLEKHGVSFLTAAAMFDHPMVDHMDDREDYGEVRIVGLGQVDGKIYRAVYTWRGDKRVRIISAKRARRHEREEYFREIHDE
jgi:uncharacterized DUF497 family protein